jgi:hypothetical protein
MAPNWASTPQNHPKPKVAVSKASGAAVSMGGIVPGDGMFWDASFMTDSSGNGWRPALGSPAREQDAVMMAVLDTAMVNAMMAPNIFRMTISFLWMGGGGMHPFGWKHVAACYSGIRRQHPHDNHDLRRVCKDFIKMDGVTASRMDTLPGATWKSIYYQLVM